MSEIFSSLKRAGSKKPEAFNEPGPIPINIFVDDAAQAPEPAHAAALPAIKPAAIEIVQSGGFDLAAADYILRTVFDPHTVAGEQYRLLRSKLTQMQRERGIKTILVTSSVPYEGKTFVSCCLAGVFAQEPGKRVLLIDADLRKPRVGRSFGVNGNAPPGGLSLVLRGQQDARDALLNAKESGLCLLPAGPIPQDPAELLSSPNMELTLRSLAAEFDWVVIDSPPVVAMADAGILAPLCDGILLVVQQERTSAKLVKQTIQRLGQKHICGVVLNRGRHLKSSRYYYSYYHKRSDEVLTS